MTRCIRQITGGYKEKRAARNLRGEAEQLYMSGIIEILDTQYFRLTVFVVTFLAALFPLLYSKKKTRRVFLLVFFTLLVVQVLTVSSTWPFYSWGLVTGTESTEITFTEVRLAGAEGNEIRYDARAVNPLGGSIVRRYGTRMVDGYTDEETLTIGSYFLTNAREYRTEREENGFDMDLSIPRHQRDYKWSETELGSVGEFQELRVYEVHVEITEDGTQVLNRTEKLRIVVTDTEVIRYAE